MNFFSRDFNLDIESDTRPLVQYVENAYNTAERAVQKRFQDLPVEILTKIASHLNIKEVKSLLFMCKSLNGIALYDHPDFQELTFPSNYLAGWHLFCYKYLDHRYDLILTRRLFKLIAEDVKLFIENSLVGYRPTLIRPLFPPQLYVNKFLTMPESLAMDCYQHLKIPSQIIQQKIFYESESLRNSVPDLAALRIVPSHPYPSQALPASIRVSFRDACEPVKKMIESCLDVHIVYLMGRTGAAATSGARAAAILNELEAHDSDSRLRRREILVKCDRFNYGCTCKNRNSPFKENKRFGAYVVNYLQGDEIFCANF